MWFFRATQEEDDMRHREQSSAVSDWFSLGIILFVALYYGKALIDSVLRLLSLR
jgi:hypothetical protein